MPRRSSPSTRRSRLVRGIRTKPIISEGPGKSVRGQPRSMQDPKWRKGLSLLEKHDLSWDLRVVWWHLEEAAEVVREHPRLRTVLNHTGYPLDRSPEALTVWRRGMEALAACPNTACKISGLVVKGEPWTLAANRPIIVEAIRIFGVDRCMFASNFPVDGLKGSWDYLYSQFKRAVADFSLADRRKLFAGNAATVLSNSIVGSADVIVGRGPALTLVDVIPASFACAYDAASSADDGAWIDPSFTWQAAGAWKESERNAQDPGGPVPTAAGEASVMARSRRPPSVAQGAIANPAMGEREAKGWPGTEIAERGCRKATHGP